MDLENVFVTVGTTKFDKLIRSLLHPDCIKALKKRGCQRLKIQVGNGTFKPELGQIDGIRISVYRFKNSIAEDIKWADFVISHAGAGSCLETLELEKPLLVVINEDLMNNHQLELAQKLNDCRYLSYTTCDQLAKELATMDFANLRAYPKRDPAKFTKAIDYIMGFKT